MIKPRPVLVASLSVAALALAGCTLAGCNKDEGETQTQQSSPTTESASSGGGTGTDSATSGPTGGVVTSTAADGSGDASADTSGDPSAPTTGEPVPCDTPEGCTGVGGGDLAPFVLPFFRGTVCVSDTVQPGDKLALSVSTCAHPCLTVPGWKFKYTFKCTAMNCDLALMFYHPDTTGAACPADVFGEFPAGACEFTGPHAINTGSIYVGDMPLDGTGSLLMPFLTNEDIAAIAGGEDDPDSVWMRVDSHAQAEDRLFPLTFAPGNAAAPASCGPGVPGCTCRDIGL